MATKFKVLAGVHYHNGQKYATGSVVETDMDLVKKFPNKFKALASKPVEDAPKKKKKGTEDLDDSKKGE